MTDRSRLRITDRIHTGRIYRMTDRSRLRILDRIHTGRISRTADSSHRRTGSRRIGRISTITDSRPTGRTSCGVGAVCFAIISKKGQPFRGSAVAGIILGVIAVLLGIGEFFYVLTITNLMKDPANAAAFNEFFEQFQRQLGIN